MTVAEATDDKAETHDSGRGKVTALRTCADKQHHLTSRTVRIKATTNPQQLAD